MAGPFHELTVTSVREEASGSRSYALDVPEALAARFRYRAGQYVTLELTVGGERIERCYSLSSAPECDHVARITVKLVPGGRGSSHLHDYVAAGSKLFVSEPRGRFVLDARQRHVPLILIAAGSGITPILSLAKSALHATGRQVTLIYTTRSRADAAFLDELAELALRFPETLVLHVRHDDEHGALGPVALSTLLGHARGSFYVCGPAGFMDLVETFLEGRGVPSSRMHFERFVSPRSAQPADQGPRPNHVSIRLDGRKTRVPYAGGSLLAAAHAAGVPAPSSCRDGYCGTCSARCTRGDVRMPEGVALTARERARGQVLLCQAVAVGDLEPELDCDAIGFAMRDAPGELKPQPPLPRVLSALFVSAVFAAYFLLRPH